MKNLFVGISLITMMLLMLFAFISFVQKKQISKYMTQIHIRALFAIIFSLIPMFTVNKSLAVISTSLYYSMIDWLLLAFVDFLFVFTDTDFELPLIKIFRTDAVILAFMDSALIMSTIFTDFTFILVENVENGNFVGWEEIKAYGFTVHTVFDFLISFTIGVFLIKKAIEAPKFHRQNVFIVIASFAALMISNLLFTSVIHDFRYTIISYAVISLIVNDLTFHFVPRQMNSRIRTLIAENISNAVVCFDINGKCIFRNKMAKQIFESEEKCYEKYINYSALGFDSVNLKEKFDVNGKQRSFNVFSNKIRDYKKRAVGSYMTFDDMTDEIEKLKNEVFRSTHDYLTGLFNRGMFFKEVEAALRMEPSVPRYLVCTNIRNFKLINDLFGEKIGDRMLKIQADVLKEKLSEDSFVGRISGDKFALLVNKENFNSEELISGLEKVNEIINSAKFKVQIVIGIYEITDSYENVILMYDKAQLAAKNSDVTKTVAFYNTSLMEKLIHEREIIGMFDAALSDNQFKMYLQPQISSATKKAVGAEALVRWIHPEKGMIPPGDFIPVLEKSGFIYKLDMFIWESAAKKLAEWQTRGINRYIAVNISARDFYFTDLYSVFTNLVEKYKISPKNLKLEITETVLMHDMKSHSQILTRLQKFGFSVEMDDFGSGYSSLNMLKNIKMDVLKIDMAFLKKTGNIERSRIIINSIISMAKALGMMIITEGVEEETHVEFLTEAGCDIFQGYYFSRPISVEEFENKFIEAETAGGEK